MPVTVSHVLSATTPDDPAFEIRPSHWNSAHAMTLAISASEISGLFSNANGISFGLSQSSITASHNGLTSQSSQIVSANNGSYAFQTLSLSNANGISFGTSAGSAITASHNALTTAAASNHSHGNPTLALTNLTGTTASASNGFTLSLSAAAGGAASASNGSFAFNTIGFSNANNVTFGTSAGSIVTASVDGTSSISGTGALSISANGATISIGVPQLSLYASSNTTAQSSSSSFSLGSISIRGAGGVSVGYSAGEIVISGGAGGAGDGVNIMAAGTRTAATTGTVLWDTGNGITFGLNANGGSVMTASHNGLTSQSNQNVTAGNGGFAFQTLSFSDANRVSFGTSAGSAITASINARASTDAIGLNTAQTNVTWTVNSSGLSINAAGYAGTTTALTGAIAATVNSAGVNISVPATSSLVGSSGLSISTNGSTITAYAVARSEFNNLGGLAVAGAQQNNSHVSYQPFMLEWPLVASNLVIPCSIANVATAANNSTAYVDISVSAVLYTRNVSTLSSVASFNGSHTATWSSNATATVTAGKLLTATNAGTTLTPGNYWLAIHVSTNNTATGGANTTALGNTISMVLGSNISTAAQAIGQWGNQTNNTVGMYSGLGIHSTGATRASIDLASITVQGTSALNAPVAFGLRNATYQ